MVPRPPVHQKSFPLHVIYPILSKVNRNAQSSLKIILGILILTTCALAAAFAYRVTHLDEAPSWEAREKTLNQIQTELKRIAAEIRNVQGHSRCQSSSDCRVVGLGSETCKGYKNFLVYSVEDASESELLAKVSEFNSRIAKASDLSLNVPSCGVQPAEIHCIRQRCTPVGN
jgi:hypothetical protein